MEIRKTIGGGWCVTHEGQEAPYTVIERGQNRFTVYSGCDEDAPLIEDATASAAERAALKDFQSA